MKTALLWGKAVVTETQHGADLRSARSLRAYIDEVHVCWAVTAINASENQAKIYDSLTTVVWQKMLAMATANTEFDLLSGFDWSIVIGMVITILNTCAITVLCLRLKALSMLIVGVRGTRTKFFFQAEDGIRDHA